MKKPEGFTLIEVLVSVVILSTGIVFVLHAFETATVALSEMRDTIWASSVAQQEIDRMRVAASSGQDIGSGYWTGRTETHYSGFTWERNISAASFDGRPDGVDVRRVIFGVKRDGASRVYTYETYIRVARQAARPEAE